MIDGLGGSDAIFGGGGNDTLLGGAGDDYLSVSGPGKNSVDGGDGIDTLSYSRPDLTTGVMIDAASGVLPDDGSFKNIERVSLTTGAGDDTLTGGAGDDYFDGGSGKNVIDGGDGIDTLSYSRSDLTTGVTIDAASGVLPDGGSFKNIERVLLTTGAGADTMTGGAGSDYYTVDNAGDVVAELPDEGYDSVQSSTTYTLGDNVEGLRLGGVFDEINFTYVESAINGTGNALGNSLDGNSKDNILTGLGGDDFVYGNAGNDTLNGGDGNDWMSGGDGDDILIGGASADSVPDHLFVDTLTGGAGNDIFRYLSAAEGGDSITDFSQGGFNGSDRIDVSAIDSGNGTTGDFAFGGTTPTKNGVWYEPQLGGAFLRFDTDGNTGTIEMSLAVNAVNLVLSAADFIGVDAPPPPPGATEGDDILTGTPGADVINGLGGNDVINGLAGADTLSGGAGDDTFLYNTGDVAAGETINGGGGMDTLYVQTSTVLSLTTPTLLTDGSVERLLIQTKGALPVFAGFAGSQLHDQTIVVNTFNDPAVMDNENNIASLLILGSGANNDFSKLDFADSSDAEGVGAFDPVNGERIVILGSGGPDTVIGTSKSNFFFVTDGGDTLTGGATNDGFIFGLSNTTTDGLTIFGGGGVDSLQASDSTNFTGLNGATKLLDNSIERIFIPTASATQVNAIFDGKQLSDQIIIVNTFNDPVAGANGAALTINVTGAANFSQLDFNKSTSISVKSGAGILPFVSGTDIININGSAGADTITGTSIRDRFFSSLGADTLNGGDGDDVLSYFGSFSSTVSVSGDPAVDHALGDTIAGGLGTDILLAYFSTDFRRLANATVKLKDDAGIESIAIHAQSNFDTYAIFNGSQLTDQAISVNRYHDPAVTPTSKFAALSIFASGTQDFSQLAFKDADSSENVTDFSTATGERIFISGVDGQADTITGTAMNDIFLVSTGGDSLNGGAGFDAFIFEAGDVAAGMTINGGANDDSLNANVSTNFTGLNGGAALTANLLERVFISTKGATAVTASFDGAQLSGQAIHVNTFNSATPGTNVATLQINVTGTGDFSLLDFNSVFPTLNSFVSGTDIININGSAGADNITGTSINDVITGGGGADTLAGGGGSDTFIFDSAAGATATGLIAGDEITDFVAGADKLQFANVAEVASAQQAAVQAAAVTALAGASTAAQIATAMATANTTDLGVSSAVFAGDTYVYFERTGTGTGVGADDVFIKLTGIASGFSFAGDVIA